MATRNDPLINSMWKVGRKIASGGFGDVYEVKDRNGNMAIAKTERGGHVNRLAIEKEVLATVGGLPGFPMLLYYGKDFDRHVLVIERLTVDLGSLKKSMGIRIADRDVSHVACEMICRLELLHAAGYVHGDIHPSNLMIGNRSLRDDGPVYLIDFGLSREISKTTFPNGETTYDGTFSGTINFSALRVMKRYAPSRLDDLESLGYVLIYLYTGTLPWAEDAKGPDCKQSIIDVLKIKNGITPAQLCKGLPACVATFMQLVRTLPSCERPPYIFLRNQFEEDLRTRAYF